MPVETRIKAIEPLPGVPFGNRPFRYSAIMALSNVPGCGLAESIPQERN